MAKEDPLDFLQKYAEGKYNPWHESDFAIWLQVTGIGFCIATAATFLGWATGFGLAGSALFSFAYFAAPMSGASAMTLLFQKFLR